MKKGGTMSRRTSLAGEPSDIQSSTPTWTSPTTFSAVASTSSSYRRSGRSSNSRGDKSKSNKGEECDVRHEEEFEDYFITNTTVSLLLAAASDIESSSSQMTANVTFMMIAFVMTISVASLSMFMW
jgi:hypothetical protein